MNFQKEKELEILLDEIELFRDYPIPRSAVVCGLKYAFQEIKVGTPCDELLDALGEYYLVEVDTEDSNSNYGKLVWKLTRYGKELLNYMSYNY